MSGRFSSDENIIDVDYLSATSLKPRTPDTPVSEGAVSPVKQLTLSGGGAIFLKSNRSRDTTPCRDDQQHLDDFKSVLPDEMTTSAGERLKSILREKACEDGKLKLTFFFIFY